MPEETFKFIHLPSNSEVTVKASEIMAYHKEGTYMPEGHKWEDLIAFYNTKFNKPETKKEEILEQEDSKKKAVAQKTKEKELKNTSKNTELTDSTPVEK